MARDLLPVRAMRDGNLVNVRLAPKADMGPPVSLLRLAELQDELVRVALDILVEHRQLAVVSTIAQRRAFAFKLETRRTNLRFHQRFVDAMGGGRSGRA